MDPLTHGIVGALIGKAFFARDPAPDAPSWREPPRTAGRVAIVAATLGAIFPDIDIFAGPLVHNRLALMTWHRNITHSFVMLPVWALLLALVTVFLVRRLRWPAPGFGLLFLIYAAGLCSHIFLDLITSFGTMVWSPVSFTRPAWDWVFAVDLSLTAAALVPQLAAWAFRRPEHAVRRAFLTWALLTAVAFAIARAVRSINVPFSNLAVLGVAVVLAAFLLLPLRRGAGMRLGRRKWSRVGVALVVGYLAFAAGMHYTALARVRDFAASAHIDAMEIAAIPQPLSAVRWIGLITTSTGIFRLQFDLLGTGPVRLGYFADPAPNRYIADARQLRDVQVFLWFARFPLFRYLQRDGHAIVQITDLRFDGPRRPWLPRNASTPASLFTFQVVFSADGRVLSEGWTRRE
jgi:membrane-bound metal-dependent hydrolase YbcI (DUF457 family)